MTEGLIAVKYYHFVGLPHEKEGEIVQGFRRLHGSGEYRPAPFWEPEIGAITIDQSIPEYTTLHEMGHARQPWRLIYGVVLGIAIAPVWSGIVHAALSWTAMWVCSAAAERHADYVALKHCSLKGLEVAEVHFVQQGLAENYLYFLWPDAHLPTSTRAFMIHERRQQLTVRPAAHPSEVPMTPFRWGVGLF